MWLRLRGLVFNEEKVGIVHLGEGFDFLGHTIRRYPNGKVLTTPSDQAVKRLKKRLADERRALRGSNAKAVIARLDPIVRGWSAYYRSAASSRTFSDLDDCIGKLTYKWAKHSHPNKARSWIVNRHFGEFRNDKWVFGDRECGAYLPKFSWTNIVRHTLVIGGSSPDDPAQADYRAER